MSESSLVSIITPCYNGEDYVQRFLESILSQTYNKIELIFVNDGSTDNTEEIVLNSKRNLEHAGIKLVYIRQENKGLGGAINTGLKNVKGEYICWPDSDDYLESESVELRVKFLDSHPEFAVVTSDAYVRMSNDLSRCLRNVSQSYATNDDPDQFVHLLLGKSIFCSGTHMVRADAFFKTHKNGEIFPHRKGQNYQMLLPVYFRFKRYFLDIPLYNYIEYNRSMSKIDNDNFSEVFSRNKDHLDIIINTLSLMEMTDQDKRKYINQVLFHYSYVNFRIARYHKNYAIARQEYDKMKETGRIPFKVLLQYLISQIQKD